MTLPIAVAKPKVEGHMVRLRTVGPLKTALLLHKLLYTRDPKWPYITHLQSVTKVNATHDHVELVVRGANPVQATANPEWLWYESNASNPAFITYGVVTQYLATVNAMIGGEEKLEAFFESVAITADNMQFYCVDYDRTLLYLEGKLDLSKLYNEAFKHELVAADSTSDDCDVYESNWGEV